MRILDVIAGLLGIAFAAPLLLVVRMFGARFGVARALTVGRGARLFWRRRLLFRDGPLKEFAERLGLESAPDCVDLILGNVALVGPRPLSPLEPHAVASYRIALRPGLVSPFTAPMGLAPVSNEDTVDFVYAARRTFLGDLRILLHGIAPQPWRRRRGWGLN